VGDGVTVGVGVAEGVGVGVGVTPPPVTCAIVRTTVPLPDRAWSQSKKELRFVGLTE
jgi:hypothetical protein